MYLVNKSITRLQEKHKQDNEEQKRNVNTSGTDK